MRSSEIPRRCDVPTCTNEHVGEVIYLHGRCHPTAATATFLVGDEAVVECAVCEKEIARLDLVP